MSLLEIRKLEAFAAILVFDKLINNPSSTCYSHLKMTKQKARKK